MIPAPELAAMQATNESWMPEACTWLVYSENENNTSGRTQSWQQTNDPVTHASTVPGRMMEAVKAQELKDLGGEMIVGGRRSPYILDVPVRINAKIKDRFVIQGLTYEVEELLDTPTFATDNTYGCGLIP